MTDTVASMIDVASPVSSGSSGPAPARPNAALLQQVRETGLASSLALFKRALEAADDALFGFSEKSESAAERGQYMDAMRSMRLGRPAIEQTFRDQLANRFQQFIRDRGQAKAAGADSIESDTLSLVEENDLEEDLAVNGMTARGVVRHHSPLYALHQRLAAVVGAKEIDVEANPIGPPAICQALREVVRHIEADITVKLVIFKIFDRHVVIDLDQVYEDTNKVLADAGVLPHIKFTRPPRPASEAPAPRSGDAAVAEGDASADAGTAAAAGTGPARGAGGPVAGSIADAAGADEVVAALASLLASRRQGSPDQALRMAAGPAVSNQTVIEALSRLQQQGLAQPGGDGETALSLVERVERVKHELIEQLRKSGIEQAEHRVSSADEDAIDLVSMLFQFVVQDRNLPAEVQAVLSRLQIPYVRVAVKDKHLFAQRDNPARQLLDTMATASVGWSKDGDRDGRFLQMLEQTVQRVIAEYADDLGLFRELEHEFSAFLEKQKKQSEVAEQRATDAALGREKLTAARRAASEIVSTRIGTRELPPLARDVIINPWSSFLVLTHLRQGPESSEWKSAVNFVDAVVWAGMPKTQEKDFARLRTLLPQMQAFLRHGLGMVGFGEHDAQRLVAGFGALFESMHQREVVLDHAETIAAAERSLETASQSPAAGSAAAAEPEVVEAPLPDDDEFLQRVRNLKVGTWVEFADGTANPERAKISWISPFSARLLFVNRKGLKVAERSVYTLANEMRSGVAQILEVAPVFERALNSIMTRLKYEHLLAGGARPAAAGATSVQADMM
jgi:hypothetical protein